MKTYNLSYTLFIGFFLCKLTANSQNTSFEVLSIAFYNTENLFDTENNEFTFDDDYTPEGKEAWTTERYQLKLDHIAKAIGDIGTEFAGGSPHIIGLAEIENYRVLNDLINTRTLKNTNYGIVHYDSPDSRGIDVALLYNRKVFKPKNSKNVEVKLYATGGKRKYTRDILVSTGTIDKEKFAFLVNHWPSRSGGEKASENYRKTAARVNRKICDSLWEVDPSFKIINMGDFNDDPINESVKSILKTNNQPNIFQFYNPMLKLYKSGKGSLAYRDGWNLFDQILVSGKLMEKNYNQFQYYKAGIFDQEYLVTQTGSYKGYPFRTSAFNNYIGGYSDHFPVYLYLIKKKNPQ